MPRINRGLELTQQYNSLVPQAQELGIRVRPRSNMHGSRSRIAQMVEDLRNQIAQYNVPVSISGSGRTFGTEFEFMMPQGMTRQHLAAILTEAGIPTQAEGYGHTTRNWWKLITDGSLNSYTRGSELVSPILVGEEGIEMVRKALRVLMRNRCSVNRHCGFHVHVGVRRDEARGFEGEKLGFFKNLLRLYQKFDPVIDQVLAPSRRGNSNHWAGQVMFNEARLERAQNVDDLRGDHLLQSKYRKLNLLTYWRQGTVEFRHHQGTIDPLKADMWIRFVIRLVEAASKKSEGDLLSCEATLDNLLSLIEAEENEKRFFNNRAAHFQQGGVD